jgi:hypothetical protein
VKVADARSFKRFPQLLFIEMRITSGRRKCTHVDKLLYSMRLKKVRELFSGARGMPNGPNGHDSRLPRKKRRTNHLSVAICQIPFFISFYQQLYAVTTTSGVPQFSKMKNNSCQMMNVKSIDCFTFACPVLYAHEKP